MTVCFQNKGIIGPEGFEVFGLTAKETETPIGYFGTGVKYAIATLLRNKCSVSLYRGNEHFIFNAVKTEYRGQEYEYVELSGERLPFTTSLGKNWELWMAYRELAANAMDEPETLIGTGEEVGPQEGYTTIVVRSEEFDKIHHQERIFLGNHQKPLLELKGVEVYSSTEQPQWVYYNGIRALKLSHPSLFLYNITTKLQLTEDRTIASTSQLHQILGRAFSQCEEAWFIRQVLVADQRFYESRIDYHWWSYKPGEVFNEVVQHFINSRTSFSSSARSLYREVYPEDPLPDLVQWESIPMEKRRKLWAALTFWAKLGFNIPKASIRVTDSLGKSKGKTVGGLIFISLHVLDEPMRKVTGIVYKYYAQTKPKVEGVKEEDLLLDTVVDFGERLLGVRKEEDAA